MKHALRIVLGEDEPDMRQYLQMTLPLLGHEVVGVAGNGRELVEQCRATHPDLVITDIKMPQMDGIDAAREIFTEAPLPIILLSAYHEPELMERIGGAAFEHIAAYLVKPIKDADLQPAITLAVRRFQQLQALRKETNELRQALEDRKVIERAKGVLMKRANVDENSAFKRLQRLATDRRWKLVEAARLVLNVEAVSQPGDNGLHPE
jgi:response regulator NasT